MDEAPTEVLRIILNYVAEVKDRRTIIALKSLRMCNRKLAVISAEYLFEELRLEFTEASHNKMTIISRHPIYHNYVRELCVIPKPISGPLLNQQEFEAWITGTPKLPRHPDAARDKRGGHVESIAKWGRGFGSHAPHYFNDVFAEYVECFTDQGLFLPRAEAMLRNAFVRLPNLRRLLRGIHRRFYAPNESITKLHYDKKAIALKWRLAASCDDFETDQAYMVLRAAEQGRHWSGVQIDVLLMFQDFGTRIMELPDPGQSVIVRNLLTNITSFELAYNSPDTRRFYISVIAGCLWDILSRMTQLENLSCSAYRLRQSSIPRIAYIFGNTFWPHLTSLEIGRWSIMSYELAGLLRRQRSTLRMLSLSDVCMQHGTWRDVFVELQGGVLERMKLHHLGYNFDCSMGNCYDTHNEDVPEWHPLYRFVFHYVPWTGVEMGFWQACPRFRQDAW